MPPRPSNIIGSTGTACSAVCCLFSSNEGLAMKQSFHHFIASALIFFAIAIAIAMPSGARAEVDLSKSSITAISKQMNVPVEGVFKKFSASVHFDPSAPSSGSAQLTVDVGSYDLG